MQTEDKKKATVTVSILAILASVVAFVANIGQIKQAFFPDESDDTVIYTSVQENSNDDNFQGENFGDSNNNQFVEQVPETEPPTPEPPKNVRLTELDFFNASSSYGGWRIEGVKDNLGNTYGEGLESVCGYTHYNQYYINKKYANFSGTVFLNYDCRSIDYENIFEVYGDNNLLYQYTFTAGVLPQDFSIDITGVDILEIRAICEKDYDWYLGIGNPILTTE